MAVSKISIRDFIARVSDKQEGLMVDVRSPAEFATCHLRGAINIPLDRLTPDRIRAVLSGAANDEKHDVFLMCKSGLRSQKAAEKLSDLGAVAFWVVTEGGAEDLPESLIARGDRKVISLERQVRIAAGALVILGVVLGVTVAPGWLGLPAFVGAGLVFAGVTDWCGMALLLARMPWNQR